MFLLLTDEEEGDARKDFAAAKEAGVDLEGVEFLEREWMKEASVLCFLIIEVMTDHRGSMIIASRRRFPRHTAPRE